MIKVIFEFANARLVFRFSVY